jgi:hypothetical protein
MSGYVPKVGERVSIDGQIVEIFAYDESIDRMTWIVSDGGVSKNYVGDHISSNEVKQLDANGNLVVNAVDDLGEIAHDPGFFISNGQVEETPIAGAERVGAPSAGDPEPEAEPASE